MPFHALPQKVNNQYRIASIAPYNEQGNTYWLSPFPTKPKDPSSCQKRL